MVISIRYLFTLFTVVSYLKENEDIVYATCAEEKKKNRNQINSSKYRTERNKTEQRKPISLCGSATPEPTQLHRAFGPKAARIFHHLIQ